jgi:hypothetical protein
MGAALRPAAMAAALGNIEDQLGLSNDRRCRWVQFESVIKFVSRSIGRKHQPIRLFTQGVRRRDDPLSTDIYRVLAQEMVALEPGHGAGPRLDLKARD